MPSKIKDKHPPWKKEIWCEGVDFDYAAIPAGPMLDYLIVYA